MFIQSRTSARLPLLFVFVLWGCEPAGPTDTAYLSASDREAELKPQMSSFAPSLPPVSRMAGTPDKKSHPPIDYPEYVSVEQARFLHPKAEVFYLRSSSGTYIYPEWVLSLHHVVNDTIDGQPLAVTLCMLSGCAIAYRRELSGELFQLASLGTAYQGNLVLYDDRTDSRWHQLTGVSFQGPRKGERLAAALPLQRTTWEEARRFPTSKVLAPVRPVSQYEDFYKTIKGSGLGLHMLRLTKEPDPRLPPYTSGLGVGVHGEAKFYPLESIRKSDPLNDRLGGWHLLVTHDSATDAYEIFRRFLKLTPGKERILTFARHGSRLQDEETGSTWNSEGVATDGPLQGMRLERPTFTHVFWFAWAAFLPETTYARSP